MEFKVSRLKESALNKFQEIKIYKKQTNFEIWRFQIERKTLPNTLYGYICTKDKLITVAELTVLISAWTPTTTTTPLETLIFYVTRKIVIASFEFSDITPLHYIIRVFKYYITSLEFSDITLH